jgi:hypothetical protein
MDNKSALQSLCEENFSDCLIDIHPNKLTLGFSVTITKGIFKCRINFFFQDFTPMDKQFEERHLLEKLTRAKEEFEHYIDWVGGDRRKRDYNSSTGK